MLLCELQVTLPVWVQVVLLPAETDLKTPFCLVLLHSLRNISGTNINDLCSSLDRLIFKDKGASYKGASCMPSK